ncbi:MAG: sodium:solute symporter [Oscillospiraceae bacterium]|nr:sodium:solute symporter [Oscillospiraceae bacterium]
MNLAQTQTVTIIALAIFALAMVCIGVFSSLKTKTIDGFLLGNRGIGPWISAFAYGTSYFSAVVFVGYAGNHGWNIGIGSMWIGIGNAVLGCLIAWLLLARRTRTMTHTLSAKTMPEFFAARYSSKAMKIFAAIVIFVFLVPYSAAVYNGLGNMFKAIFPNVGVNTWMLVIAVLTGIYLILGGYVATAYTDFIQGIIMILGVFAMVIALVKTDAVGGFTQFWGRLAELPKDHPHGVDGAQLTSIFGGVRFKDLCYNIMLTSFGTWGLPQMVQKYYAIKDTKSIKQATVISTVFALIIGCGAYFVGSLSRLVLNNTLPLPEGVTAASATPAQITAAVDNVIPNTLLRAFGDANMFTTIILAVLLILLLSASMSTLSSIVLSSSSAISVDLIPEVKKNAKPENQVITTRVLCLIFVGLSYVFATMKISIIVNIMSFSWGIVAGTFIGPYIWGIYSKKVTKVGAWAGMIAGFCTVAIPTIILAINNGGSLLKEAIPAAAKFAPQMGVSAMAVSLIVVPIVSAFTKKYDDKFLKSVFAVKEEK